MLALFHDKKCYNCIIFVRCILWNFIVLGWFIIKLEKNQASKKN